MSAPSACNTETREHSQEVPGKLLRRRPTGPNNQEAAVGAEEDIKTIQTMYEAFGRGDAAAILACLTDDV
jgi:hypothetical protein